LLFAAASFKTGTRVNWTAPAFLSLALGAGALAADGLCSGNAARAKRWQLGGWATVALTVVAVILGHTSLAWGVPKLFAYTRAGGWRAVARRVEDARQELARQTGQQPFVVGMDKYNIAAELGFYLGQPEECVNMYALGGRGLGFRYWTDLRGFEGRPAVAVLSKGRENLLDELRGHFDHVGEPVSLPRGGHGVRCREVYLVPCTGYHAEEKTPTDPRLRTERAGS
jgi:hypothetical protein